MGQMDAGGNTYIQESFRFRADNGPEISQQDGGAYWLAPLNVDISRSRTDVSPFRIRICVTGVGDTDFHSLHKQKDGGSFFEVNPTTNHLRQADSPHVTDADDTTDFENDEDMDSANWADLDNDAIVEANGDTDTGQITFGGGPRRRIEMEWVVKLEAGMTDGAFVRLRSEFAGSTIYSSYANIGQVNIVEPGYFDYNPTVNRRRIHSRILTR